MQVRFTPEEEAKLAKIATQEGVARKNSSRTLLYACSKTIRCFEQAFEKASSRPIAANSSKKKRWMSA